MNIQNNKKYETTTKDQQKRQIKTRPQKQARETSTHARCNRKIQIKPRSSLTTQSNPHRLGNNGIIASSPRVR